MGKPVEPKMTTYIICVYTGPHRFGINTPAPRIQLDELDHGFYIRWLLIFCMRTYGVNQEFRFVEGIWLGRKSRQIQFFFSRK